MNEEYIELPKSVSNGILIYQIVFSTVLAVPSLILFVILVKHYHAPPQVIVLCSTLLIVVLNRLLHQIKMWILMSASFLEMHMQIELLCMMDEGFEEFYDKYSKGFTKEEAERIVSNYMNRVTTDVNNHKSNTTRNTSSYTTDE